ncbi:MAG: rhomboid family intramembrane serine protease [Chloroflexi bacterium]|nr:MAG: rhomboid family intramembrane serine protease [Chloroflexota bacterium]
MAIIPLSAQNTSGRRSFPVINTLLILANIAVFVYEVVQGPAFATCLTNAYALVPTDVLQNTSHATGCALSEPHPVALTLLTSLFLHASWLHVGGNMLYLWVFGGQVEGRLGHLRYLFFYLLCGVVASAAQIAFSIYASQTTILTLGASGAIAGVLGAYLIFFPGSKVRSVFLIGIVPVPLRLWAFIVIGLFIVLQIVEGYLEVLSITSGQQQSSGGVAFFAHIGGFLLGVLVALGAKLGGGTKNLKGSTSYPSSPPHRDWRTA